MFFKLFRGALEASGRFMHFQGQAVQALLPSPNQNSSGFSFYFDLFTHSTCLKNSFLRFKNFEKRNPGPNDFWNANTRQVHSSLGMAFAASRLAGLPQGLEHTQEVPGKGGGGARPQQLLDAPGFPLHTPGRAGSRQAASPRGAPLVTACRLKSPGSPPWLPGAGCVSAAR